VGQLLGPTKRSNSFGGHVAFRTELDVNYRAMISYGEVLETNFA
jgi:hypothetical protein